MGRQLSPEELKNATNKLKKYVKVGVGSLVALILAFGSFDTVQPGERGIRVTLGKTGDEVLGEGPHLKLPIVSSIRKMSVLVQKTQDSTEAATKDLQRVGATVALNWTINPDSVGKMLREVGTEELIQNNIIAPAVSEVLKASTAKMNAEEVLTRRMELKANIDELLIKRLTSYGLVVKDISLVDLNFTNEFNRAVEEKQIAEQQAKQAEYVAQKASQDAKALVNSQKGTAEATVIQAKAQAEATLAAAKAKSEAQRLLQQTLTPELLQQQAIDKWDGGVPYVMGSNGQLLFGIDPSKLPQKSSSSKSTSTKESEESEEE